MEITFNVNALEGMKRAELQKLCKNVGIKANSKNAKLIEALKEYMYAAHRVLPKFQLSRSSVAQKRQSQNTSCVMVNEAKKTDALPDTDDNESYKKKIMDQLEKKVEEKMPVECKIPRFVQFTSKGNSAHEDTNKTPAAKWNKIHNAQFEKMDSIDVYLEKKRKRMEGFNQSAKRAKSVGVNKKRESKPAEVPTFKPTVTLNKSATFVFGSPAAKPFFQPGNKKVSIAASGTASGKKHKLKSPKVFKPILSGSAMTSGKQKTPANRRTIAVTTDVENKPKTPANPARKSTAVTPFRFLPANIPAAPTPTPNKKFDIKASLAKPLPYKPHTGKLKPLSSKKEDYRQTIGEAKLKSRKVDVKSAKVTTRVERRKKEVKSRENKRANTLSRRRGLAY